MPIFETYDSITLTRINKRGGGVSTSVKDYLPHSVIGQFSLINDTAECLVLQVAKKVTAVIYQLPGGSKTEFLNFHEELLQFLSKLIVSLTITGDVNIDTSLVNMYAAHQIDFRDGIFIGCMRNQPKQ